MIYARTVRGIWSSRVSEMTRLYKSDNTQKFRMNWQAKSIIRKKERKKKRSSSPDGTSWQAEKKEKEKKVTTFGREHKHKHLQMNIKKHSTYDRVKTYLPDGGAQATFAPPPPPLIPPNESELTWLFSYRTIHYPPRPHCIKKLHSKLNVKATR